MDVTQQILSVVQREDYSWGKRRPAERTGVIQQWYDWRDRWQKEQAKEWMRDNGVDFKDGRIVCGSKHSFIWSWEDEDDEIDNL